MKADDYVKIAREMLEKPPLRSTIWKGMPPEEEGPADESDIVCEVIRRILSEVKPLADARRVNTEAGIVAIMKELRQKWFAICDRMNHPMFQKPSFSKFCEILNQKTPPAPVRPKRRPRPKDDSDEAPKKDLPW